VNFILYVTAFESYRITDRETDRHTNRMTPKPLSRRFAGGSDYDATDTVIKSKIFAIQKKQNET